MQGTRLTDASRGTSGSPPGDQQPPDRPCESSPVYDRYIDDVARRIFDPASLGNLDQLKTKYNCEIETSQNPMKFVKQALDRDDNDPYTSYLTPKEFQKIVDAQRGKVMGAGVTFVMPTTLEDKTGARPPLIVQDFEGTAKRGHGIQPGDQILAVDGVSMQGKSWRDGLRALDGAENTKVKLHIKRNGTESDVELTRTNEDGVNVTSQMLDNKFAHIRVREFINDHTSNQIESAILDNPKAEGYILDLRHNPGGLLDQAFTSASLFIKEGEVLKIKSRIPSDPADPKYSMNTYSLSKDLITIAQDASMPIAYKARHQDRVNKPVVVLIDQGTASAAEILAGALKDTDGAYVIGTPSYGKGVGQEIGKDIPTGGALKITTFRYYTPSGFWPGDGHATRIGINPNLIVDNPKPADYYTQRDGQLNAALSYLRTAK
jgi:carboxyl-terminal processing protease